MQCFVPTRHAHTEQTEPVKMKTSSEVSFLAKRVLKMAQVIPLGPASRLMTTSEAALRLGVSLRTIQLWVEARILPASRTPGGHRRIPYGAVEALAINMGLGVDEQAEVHGSKPSYLNGAANASRVSAQADVLMISDDGEWQSAAVQALGNYENNMNLRVASNGYEGLIHIGERTPELLIVSLELPGMDGFQMLRTLEDMRLLDDIQVMAMTSSDIQAKGGLPAGIELLPWPVSHDTLCVRVGRWLLLRQSAQGVSHE